MSTSIWDNDGLGSGTGIPVPSPEGVGLYNITELGGGQGLVKSIDVLTGIAYFRTFLAGSNITLTESVDGNTVTINSTVPDTYTLDDGSASYYFTSIAAQTDFHINESITLTTVHVWRGGIKLLPTTEYTVDTDNNDVVFVDACVDGEVIEILVSGSFVIDLGILGTFTQNVEDTATNAAAAIASAASALGSAGLAESYAETTAVNAALAIAAWDDLDDVYLGAKAANPTLDNDGDALVVGSFYFNTVSGQLRFFAGGTTWVENTPDIAPVWGAITGTLASQTDLQSALDGKSATGHTHSYLPLAGGTLTGDLTLTGYDVTCAEVFTTGQVYTGGNSSAVHSRHWIRNLGAGVTYGSQLWLNTQANDGLSIVAATTSAGINDYTGSFYITASGSISFAPGATSNLTLEADGSWNVNGSNGTAGQVLTSNGAAAPPGWANGTAATLTTPRAIYGNNFDGSAALTQVIAGTYGGTGVNNSTRTITYAGNVTFTGAYNVSFTVPGAYTYTLPGATATLAQLGANTFTADQALGNNDITGVKTFGFNGTYDHGSQGASFTLDLNLGQDSKVTLTGTGAMTITLTAPLAVGIYRIQFTNAGLRTITFAYTSGSPVFRKKGGTALSAFTASGVDLLYLRWNGTDYFVVQDLDWKA